MAAPKVVEFAPDRRQVVLQPLTSSLSLGRWPQLGERRFHHGTDDVGPQHGGLHRVQDGRVHGVARDAGVVLADGGAALLIR
jgi:hypothetical protein